MANIDFNAKKGFICDMDGVIYHGNIVLPGVKEFIDWLNRENKRYLFLTNNSNLTPPALRASAEARKAGGWTSPRIISIPVLWQRLRF